MFKPTVLFLAALLATTQAAPATSVNPRADTATGNLLTPDTTSATGAIDMCGASSFNDKTSGASPLVSDCEQMARNIEGDGTWVSTSPPNPPTPSPSLTSQLLTS